jgi:hypothetical protein
MTTNDETRPMKSDENSLMIFVQGGFGSKVKAVKANERRSPS